MRSHTTRGGYILGGRPTPVFLWKRGEEALTTFYTAQSLPTLGVDLGVGKTVIC